MEWSAKPFENKEVTKPKKYQGMRSRIEAKAEIRADNESLVVAVQKG